MHANLGLAGLVMDHGRETLLQNRQRQNPLLLDSSSLATLLLARQQQLHGYPATLPMIPMSQQHAAANRFLSPGLLESIPLQNRSGDLATQQYLLQLQQQTRMAAAQRQLALVYNIRQRNLSVEALLGNSNAFQGLLQTGLPVGNLLGGGPMAASGLGIAGLGGYNHFPIGMPLNIQGVHGQTIHAGHGSPCRVISDPPASVAPSLENTGTLLRLPQLPVVLARPDDNLKLSDHQVLLRHQIEAFQAGDDDISTHTRGRNKPITVNQVGIRCQHCAHLPVSRRQKGSTYFPASLAGIYQASQNMSTIHFQSGLCTEMPQEIKDQFTSLHTSKTSTSGAGRPFWAKGAAELGLVDTEEEGIRYVSCRPQFVWSTSSATGSTES
jgi:hypothetical protein